MLPQMMPMPWVFIFFLVFIVFFFYNVLFFLTFLPLSSVSSSHLFFKFCSFSW